MFSEHAFLVYKIATQANSAVPVMVPEKTTNSAIKVDVEAMLAAVTPKTRMVYIANPNNPTGSYLNRDEMARLHAGLPKNVLLVIDAAYGEYVTAKDYEAGIGAGVAFDNVVMTRTFSKLYGLAGLRIGWMYAPAAVCDVINRIRGPFNTSLMQQLAGAAAVRDREHFWTAVEHNSKWLPWITAEIRKTGLRVDDSAANFVLIHFRAEGEKERGQGRCLPDAARRHPAGGRQLRPARLPAHDRGHRGTEPAGGVAACSNSWRPEDESDEKNRHHRIGADRLLHRPCGAAGKAGGRNRRP